MYAQALISFEFHEALWVAGNGVPLEIIMILPIIGHWLLAGKGICWGLVVDILRGLSLLVDVLGPGGLWQPCLPIVGPDWGL